MHPFKISLTAVRLDCLANWLSTGDAQIHQEREFEADASSRSTFNISKLVFQKNDFVVLRQLRQERKNDRCCIIKPLDGFQAVNRKTERTFSSTKKASEHRDWYVWDRRHDGGRKGGLESRSLPTLIEGHWTIALRHTMTMFTPSPTTVTKVNLTR